MSSAPRFSTPDPTTLRAVTVAVEPGAGPPVDPFELAGDAGQLFVGPHRVLVTTGTAAVISLPGGLDDPAALAAVHRWLAAVPHQVAAAPSSPTRAVGTGGAESADGPSRRPPAVLALGALPFDRSAPGCLVVPQHAYCRDQDGCEWTVHVGRAGRPPATASGWPPHPGAQPPPAAGTPARLEDVAFVPSGSGYADAVSEAVAAIRAGRLDKVVLARSVRARLGRPATPAAVARDLWGGDPTFTAFSLPFPGGRIAGASPELIVRRHGREVTSHPFAGTVRLGEPAGDDEAVDRLLRSAKDREEHRLVVDEIAAVLAARCADVTVPPHPSVVRMRSDARLGTVVRGTLGPVPGSGPTPDITALTLLADLHPTPAVGGVPRAEALATIAALEPAPRGRWAGPVGWVDANGDGEWVLAIRCAVWSDQGITVSAGAGIVAASDPDTELVETTFKLAPVLEALSPGGSGLL